MAGIPVKLSETPGETKSPIVGPHMTEILTSFGHDEGEIEKLKKEGVI